MQDTSSVVLSAAEAKEYAVLKVSGSPTGTTSPHPTVAQGSALPSTPPPSTGAALTEEGGSPPPTSPPAASSAYYWERPDTPAALPVVVAHNVHYAFARVYATMELVGDFFAEFFGLYNSRYEWAIELERRHQEEAEEREYLETRKKRFEELRRLNNGKPMVGVPVVLPSKKKDDSVEEEGLLGDKTPAEAAAAAGGAALPTPVERVGLLASEGAGDEGEEEEEEEEGRKRGGKEEV